MVTVKTPDLPNDWLNELKDEFQQDYFANLKDFLISEQTTHVCYPPNKKIFAAFNYTPFNDVKVVIIGQDPYHGPGQANGLCFSVIDGIKHPPSLKNIFKELESDLGIQIPKSGDLSAWAKKGVLMLNATLTVRHKTPGSHQKKGWETFTDAVINKLNAHRENLVFLLWGNYAKQKASIVDRNKHKVLDAAHPSPFSAHNGFFGCKHFSKTNAYLKSRGISEINWKLD